jgi:hypothetical protein
MAGTSALSRPTSASRAPAAAAPAASATVATGVMSTIPAEPPRGSDITDRAWHDSYVPVVFLIAIVVVLVAIFFAATGRGGELAYEQADHAPLDLGPVSSADIALLRPPTALWGYNMQVTDAALDQIARAMRDRDITIAYLQDQLAGYQRNGSHAEPRGAHARPGPEIQDTLESDAAAEIQDTAEFDDTDEEALGILPAGRSLIFFDPPDAAEPPDAEGTAGTLEPAEAGDPAEAPAATPPRATLRLRASGPKAPAEPGPHDPTQPSPAPGEEGEEPHDPTHPAAAVAAEDGPGPQGAFDTHGWWAEQKEAAREEQAHRQSEPGEEDDLAAVEEQGW